MEKSSVETVVDWFALLTVLVVVFFFLLRLRSVNSYRYNVIITQLLCNELDNYVVDRLPWCTWQALDGRCYLIGDIRLEICLVIMQVKISKYISPAHCLSSIFTRRILGYIFVPLFQSSHPNVCEPSQSEPVRNRIPESMLQYKISCINCRWSESKTNA